MTMMNYGVKTGVLVWGVFLAACSRLVAPEGFTAPDGNWRIYESEHFIYYVRENAYGEENIAAIRESQERAFMSVITKLDLSYENKIVLYIYDSAEDAGWDKIRAYAFPRTETVAAVYSRAGKSIGVEGVAAHEITHILSWNSWGAPEVRFLSEGVAVAMDGVWHSSVDQITDLHERAGWLLADNQLPDLSALVQHWTDYSGDLSYPVSGSFLLYLLDGYGVERLRLLFSRARRETFIRDFEELYPKSFLEIEAEWRNFLTRYEKSKSLDRRIGRHA